MSRGPDARALRRWGAIAVSMLLLSACGGGETSPAPTASPDETPGEAATPDPSPPDAPPSPGAITDLAITSVVFEDRVTLTNLGDGPVGTEGLWLCNRPFYTPVPPMTLEPGTSVDLPVDELADLPVLGGEVALYRTNDFEDPGALVDYVQWGRGGGRARAATEAGLWPDGDVVDPTGPSITAPNGGSEAADWRSG